MSTILVINEDVCTSCGACLVFDNLVKERADGKAEVRSVKPLEPEELHIANDLLTICLESAISLVSVERKSISELNLLLDNVKEKLSAINVPNVMAYNMRPSKEDYIDIFTDAFHGTVPYQIIVEDYKSHSKAIRACLDYFKRYAYSKVDHAIMSGLQAYKEKYIMPYYTFSEDSFYGRINRQISKHLRDLQENLFLLSGGKIILPDDYSVFNIYPDSKHDINILKEFHIHRKGFVKDEFDYSASHYEVYMDTRDWEDWNDKTVYNIVYPEEALQELANDLCNAMCWSDIGDGAEIFINHVIDDYREIVEKTISERLNLAI